MNLKRGLIIGFLALLLANIIFISGDFSVAEGNSSAYYIDTIYGPGDYLRGWINLSLDNEAVDSLVEDNRGNEITLIKLLESNADIYKDTDYVCSPSDCGVGYTASNPEESKSFSLEPREEKILGFEFDRDIEFFELVEFDVYSDAGEDCDNQLKVDFFADETVMIGNNKSSSTVCTGIERIGCFNKTKKTLDEVEVYNLRGNGDLFCQRITLTESPSFTIGAWVIEGEDDQIRMWLYSEEFGDYIDTCNLPSGETSDEGEYKSCTINYATTEEEDYYICVDTEDDLKVSKIIGYESEDSGCGFYHAGGGAGAENYAFDFFAQGMQFAPVENIAIREDLPNSQKLSDLFEDYIGDRYNRDLNCEEGCVVPVRFVSKTDQNIIVENITVTYKIEQGPTTDITDIAELSTSPATVSTVSNDFKKISLNNANFSMPTEFKTYSYEMTLGGEEIFSDAITVEKIPSIKSLSPLLTVSSFPTTLKVKVELANNASITNYKWEIGSNVTKTTTTNELVYSFPEIKTYPGYPVKITVTDANGKTASKTFNVVVESPSTMISQRLEEMQTNLGEIIEDIDGLPLFYKTSVKNIINTDELNGRLTDLQRAFTQASGEDDYNEIISEILELRIPESITTGMTTGSMSFYPNQNNVNLNAITTTAGGSYAVEEESVYKSSVVEWNAVNLNTKVTYTQINAMYDRESEALLNVFEIHTKENAPVEYQYYFFVDDMENLLFDKSYDETAEEGYVSILIDSPDKIIKLSTTEAVTFVSLPAFFSPSLDNLDVLEIIEEGEEPGIRWALFILILFFLAIFGVVIYIVMQYWYKTKYETYLFKNRNFLFNLINYINSQKKKGTKEKDIVKKLKKQGWNSEQITYVMRKYLGKRTGMWEIPVEKLLSIFRKKQTAKPGAARMSGARAGIAPAMARQPFGKPRPGRFRPGKKK